MYSNAKIPAPFCRPEGTPARVVPPAAAAEPQKPAVSASEAGTPAGKKQTGSGQPDTLPLLAFLLAEFFR